VRLANARTCLLPFLGQVFEDASAERAALVRRDRRSAGPGLVGTGTVRAVRPGPRVALQEGAGRVVPGPVTGMTGSGSAGRGAILERADAGLDGAVVSGPVRRREQALDLVRA